MVSDLNKNFGGSTDLAKKRHGSADLHAPIPLPPHPVVEGKGQNERGRIENASALTCFAR